MMLPTQSTAEGSQSGQTSKPLPVGPSQEKSLAASTVNAMMSKQTETLMGMMTSLLQTQMGEVYSRMNDLQAQFHTELPPRSEVQRFRPYERLGHPVNTSTYGQQDLQTQGDIQHLDFAATEELAFSDQDDDVCDDLSLYAKGNTSDGSDVSASDPGPVVFRTTRRIFVIGESHLKPAHYCNFKALLEAAGAEVAMYEAIGGATFTNPKVTTAMEKAVQEVRQDDVVLLMVGSNDARNIAREEKPDTLPNLKAILDVMAAQASEKKFHLLVVSPLPSPCYVKPWCRSAEGELCEHEQRYLTAQTSIQDAITSALANAPEHTLHIHKGYFKKLLTRQGQIARRWFEKNNIHLNCYGAELLCSALLMTVRKYLF